jgi:hypothetical protein
MLIAALLCAGGAAINLAGIRTVDQDGEGGVGD